MMRLLLRRTLVLYNVISVREGTRRRNLYIVWLDEISQSCLLRNDDQIVA